MASSFQNTKTKNNQICFIELLQRCKFLNKMQAAVVGGLSVVGNTDAQTQRSHKMKKMK